MPLEENSSYKYITSFWCHPLEHIKGSRPFESHQPKPFWNQLVPNLKLKMLYCTLTDKTAMLVRLPTDQETARLTLKNQKVKEKSKTTC